MAISAEDRDFLVSLYVGYFNRAPDPAGLQFWIDQVEAGRDTNTIAADFAASPEAKSLYPFLTTPDVSSPTSFITAVYANLFNRAPDAAGQAFWEQQLSSGAVSPADAIDAIIKGATTAPDSTILTNKNTVGLDFATDAGNTPGFTFDLNGASGSAATSAISGVTEDTSTVIAAQAATDAYLNGIAGAGETLTLTTGVDDLAGTASNDTFKGLVDGAATETLNALDEIDGGAGTDTLEIAAVGALTTADIPTTITSVENITVRATGGVTVDSSGISGVTSLASTQSTTSDLTAAASTDISVSGATGQIDVDGGKDITVTDANDASDINVGVNAQSAGTVTVTDTNNEGANDIVVDGGTDVTVTTTATETSGDITVGGGSEPSGAVVVTQNTNSDSSAAVAVGDVTVTGGSTIAITANITNTAQAGVAAANVTAGTYTATAGDNTTSISVTQNNIATDVAATSTGGSAETAVVTFGALAAGEAVIIGDAGAALTAGTDLMFIASKALTAQEVAAAFANLTAADTQANGGIVANGTFTGALDAGWTSGVASGATVTFTSTADPTSNVNSLTIGTDDDGTAVGNDAAANADFSVAVTEGVAPTTTAAVDVTATDGAVVADDNATASVTTVNVDGFVNADLGTNAGFDALTDLTLANGAGAIVLDTAQTSLKLSLDGIAAGSTFNLDSGAATVATLNLTTTGEASDVDFTAGAVTTANITAGANLDVSGGTFAAVTTANVSGAGNVNLGDVSATIETLAASTATGVITATVDGTKAAVTTGDGADVITINTAGLSKAVDLGAGDDTLILTGAATTPTATINGGAGTNILSLTDATAAARDGDTNFGSAFTNFSTLSVGAGASTIDVKNLGFASSVILAGAHTGILNNLASGGTVELKAATNDVTLNVEDAATNASDALSLVTNVAGSDVDFGDATIGNVQTINLTANDTLEDDDNNGTVTTAEQPVEIATLELNAANATTLNINGSANVTLDDTSVLTALTTVNAGSLTGTLDFEVQTNGVTVTGGSGADKIEINADSVTVNSGAGDDVITIADNADLVQINGGDGADTFVFAGTSTNDSNFTVINGIGSGDKIDLNALGVTSFKSTAITLSPGATETTQAFLDQAMVNLAAGEAGWFTSGGNTFIAVDVTGESATNFVDDEDFVVMLTGVLDLSAGATFNSTSDTLEIV
jgi:hypothetical protein